MILRTLVSLGVSLLAWTVATPVANAQLGGGWATMTTKEKRAFIGLSGGAAYAMVNHPQILTDGFAAATLGLHAGYNVSERISVGFDVFTVEHGMKRSEGTEPFIPTGYTRPQAGCTNCEPPPKGGWVSETTAMFGTVGPRVEFSPFGRDGLYLGGSTGVAMMLGVDTQYGFGGVARAGYRFRVGNVLGLGVEGGFQGQYFGTGTMMFPYASLIMRPYF
ncbi:MAG: hypothetical protein IPM54_23095 [Polyangiaceae bacterium]|nr:hypothetical protein [Polyangiaceae bacterium]